MEKFYQILTTLILLFFYLKIDQVSAQFSHKGRKQLCGSALTDTLEKVCYDYNGMTPKRSKVVTESDYWIGAMYDDPSSVNPFRRRSAARALIPERFRRRKRGVVDECCRKSCTLDELQGYCGSQ